MKLYILWKKKKGKQIQAEGRRKNLVYNDITQQGTIFKDIK